MLINLDAHICRAYNGASSAVELDVLAIVCYYRDTARASRDVDDDKADILSKEGLDHDAVRDVCSHGATSDGAADLTSIAVIMSIASHWLHPISFDIRAAGVVQLSIGVLGLSARDRSASDIEIELVCT